MEEMPREAGEKKDASFLLKKDVVDGLDSSLILVLNTIDKFTPQEALLELKNVTRSIVDALVVVCSLPEEKWDEY